MCALPEYLALPTPCCFHDELLMAVMMMALPRCSWLTVVGDMAMSIFDLLRSIAACS
jgi:hypothetical protein